VQLTERNVDENEKKCEDFCALEEMREEEEAALVLLGDVELL
jgi:hypothetical protein